MVDRGPGYRSVIGKDLGFTRDNELLLRGTPIGGGTGSADLPNVRKVTAAGAVTVDADDDDIVFIKKTVGGATTVNLPASEDREGGRFIKIVDGKLDCLTNNITITPAMGETIVGLSTYVLRVNGGSVTLWASPDEDGWYI